jgi:hypothetical protein
MVEMTLLQSKIIKAKTENPTLGYKAIAKLINCAPNSVRFHTDPTVKQKRSLYRAKQNRKNFDAIKQAHGGKCHNCSYNRCLAALQFHHRDPSAKIQTISRLIRNSGFSTAVKEAEKCTLLCANCHAELHDGLLTIQ